MTALTARAKRWTSRMRLSRGRRNRIASVFMTSWHRHRSLIVAVVALVNGTARPQRQASEAPRTVHVFVALADNRSQGIVPVAAVLGNGEDANRNLYWGSAYGVKAFFARSSDWQLVTTQAGPK